MFHAYGPGFGLGFLNFLGTLLFFALLIGFLSFVLRRGRFPAFGGPRRWSKHRGKHGYGHGYGGRSLAGPDAAEAARERYAKGDISAEEYERLKKGLANGAAHEEGEGWLPWGRDRALETARLRFAKGEITAEEFGAIKETLGS